MQAMRIYRQNLRQQNNLRGTSLTRYVPDLRSMFSEYAENEKDGGICNTYKLLSGFN